MSNAKESNLEWEKQKEIDNFVKKAWNDVERYEEILDSNQKHTDERFKNTDKKVDDMKFINMWITIVLFILVVWLFLDAYRTNNIREEYFKTIWILESKINHIEDIESKLDKFESTINFKIEAKFNKEQVILYEKLLQSKK